MTTAHVTCPLCEATCGLEVTIDEKSLVTRVQGDREDVFSKGYICPKGASLGALHHDPDRLTAPLVKRDGEFVEVTWDEAFAEIDRRLRPIIDEHGKNAVAVYSGNPTVHNAALVLYGRVFFKALGTRNFYTATTVDQMPKHFSSGYLFGDPQTIPVADLDRTGHLLILGANPLVSNGSLMTAADVRGRLRGIQERGGKIVVLDPRRTRTAQLADEHHAIRPGTDALFLFALVNVLFAENRVRPGEHVDGVDEVRALAEPFTPEAVAPVTGIDAAEIRRIALDLADAERAAVYGRMGTTTQSYGTIASWLVDVVNTLTGNLDREGGVMFPLPALWRPRRSSPFTSGRWTSRVRGYPEVLGELPVATLADEIETPGDGQVRALVTIAGNPALTTPDAARLDALLAGLELLVCVDPYLNATTRHAHVILPPPSLLEKSHYDLAFTGLAVRDFADFSPPVFERANGTPSEFELLVRLAAIAAGFGPGVDPHALATATLRTQVEREVAIEDSLLHGREADEVVAELEASGRPPEEQLLDLMLRSGHRGDGFGARPDGLSLDLLERHPHGIDFGPLCPRLPDALATESGLVELAPKQLIDDLGRLERALEAAASGGMVLVGRRQLRTANSWTHNVPVLVRGKESCFAQIHPDDAARFGLVDGAMATVRSAAGAVEVPVQVTDVVMPGVVCIPYGWGHGLPGTRQSVAAEHAGVNVNVLTDASAIDPVSGNAVLNGIPVTVAPT